MVTMKGNPLTLLGSAISAGDKAPDINEQDKEYEYLKGKVF